ncbi:MAG TPA: alpha/beta hydrolase [Acetobacteraceae bacterium]|nr:alpha/beta hydrolase [Acetobacteraceae bacterium]
MRDANAALSLLQAQGVPPNRTVLWGESLGTGIAIRLAARSRVAALILQFPYTSLEALARRQFPWIPGLRLLLRDRFDSLAHIGGVRSPILVMIAGDDRVIPPDMSRSLLAEARAPAQLWEAPGADHNDLQAFGAVDAAAIFLRHLGERGCGADHAGNW